MPSVGSLIGTGITLGFVHVLTGPDHLSAMATLSANANTCEAFCLGVRWGLGHSSGLIVVGAIFIAISTGDTIEVPDTATIVFNSLVGVFMLLLGTFGMVRAWRKRPSQVIVYELPFTAAVSSSSGTGAGTSLADAGQIDSVPRTAAEPVMVDELPLTAAVSSSSGTGASMSLADVGQVDSVPCTAAEPAELESLEDTRVRTCCGRCWQSLSVKLLAFAIGLIHGVGGPGGVLGVIPAVQLKNWKLSTLYLGCFCISSTLVMGCFAALYGTCSAKLGKERGARGEFIMECVSASLSIVVGILWLTLLALGKLEDIFP